MAEQGETAKPEVNAMQDPGPSASGASGTHPPRPPRHDPPEKYVYVTCFDNPFKLIECELSILEPFQPRLLLAIKYEPPSLDQHGRKFWRTGMKYAVFLTFMHSLRHQRLGIGHGLTLNEVMNAFAYEGVVLAPPATEREHFKRLAEPHGGVGFSGAKREPIKDYLELVTEQIGNAIIYWPRLMEMLKTAKLGGRAAENCASTTACWISLDVKPGMQYLQDESQEPLNSLCDKNPPWLLTLLQSVGVTRAQQIRSGVLTDEYSMAHFTALTRSIRASPLQSLWGILNDVPKHARSGEQAQDFYMAKRFAHNVRETVMLAPQEKDLNKVTFCRALVGFVLDIMRESPSYSSTFGPECCDDTNSSPERKLLTAALKERKVRIVRWGAPSAQAAKLRPLAFPGLGEVESKLLLLLDFSKLI